MVHGGPWFMVVHGSWWSMVHGGPWFKVSQRPHRLACVREEAVAVHQQHLEPGHCRLQARVEEAGLGVASVSHVSWCHLSSTCE